tara:strand:- start:118 stop:2031 length:1914 start_codon:yes stop_codon:yes gene_type:complete
MADEALTTENIISKDLSSLTDEEFNSYYKSKTGRNAFQPASKGDTEYLEIAGSVLGGIGAGALAGTMGAGPIGTIVGGIAGGMAGAFGGELLEDVIDGKDLDYSGAATEAAISGGFDVATLGAGKIIRPAFAFTKIGSLNNQFSKLLNIAKPVQGSRGSLAQTQELLAEGGGSLNPRAVEEVGRMRSLFNEIAEIGMFSRTAYAADRKKAENIIKSHINDFGKGGQSVDDLGEQMFNLIESGRKAADNYYGDELAKIINKASPKRNISTGQVDSAISKLIKKYETNLGSELTSDVLKELKTFRNNIMPDGKPVNVDVRTMLGLQRQLNRAVDDAMPGGAKANSTDARQLSEASSAIKLGIENAINKVDPKIYADYKSLNSTYKSMKDAISPKVNAGLIRRASSDDFQALGSMLLNQTNNSKIKLFMKSIDASYDALKRSGGLKDLAKNINSAKKAKEAVRASYARNMFGEPPVFDQATINQFNKPKNQERMSTIFGDEWPKFKKVLNAVGDSLRTTEGGVLSLALRGRELTAGTQLAAIPLAGAAGGAAGGTEGGVQAGVFTAAAVLLAPSVLYKLSKNPKAVNKLIAFEKKGLKPSEYTPEVVLSTLAKIFNPLRDDEKKEIKKEAYDAGYYNINY